METEKLDAIFEEAKKLRFPPGWLSKLVKLWGLDLEQERYLDTLADRERTRVIGLEKVEREMNHKLKGQLRAFRDEIYGGEDGEYYKGCRRQYLMNKLLNTKVDLISYRLKSGNIGSFLFDPSPIENEILKIEGELESLERKVDDSQTLTEGEIDRASNYPLPLLLGRRAGEKVICPFHDDTKPSFYLYEKDGYCFSCNHFANSIHWLREVEGLSFVAAVRKLNALGC